MTEYLIEDDPTRIEDAAGHVIAGGYILSSIIFCRMCRCFGKDGKPFCTKFDFFDESMLDGKGFCYWGERV